MRGLALALCALAGGAFAETRVDPIACAAHFQARAEWMRALGGNPATIDLMHRYAHGVLVPEPGDWGMFTGFSHSREPPSEPPRALVLEAMTAFAEAGHHRHLPLCMEDVTCSRCTDLLSSMVGSEGSR